jgi:hypothetical protein
MAYTSHSSVTLLTGEIYSANSKPLSSTDAISIIAQADAEIDAILSQQNLTVPSPVPASVELVSRLLSAAYCEERVYTGQSINESKRAATWRKRALGAKYDDAGELGGLLKAYVSTQRGLSSGPRYQTELDELDTVNSPQFTRESFT